MSAFRVYIKPFDSGGNYVPDFIDVTEDVDFNSMGSVQRQIENDDFAVGVFRYSKISLTLRNENGTYGEANSLDSIFKFRRSGAIVKITWDQNNFPLLAGMFPAGEPSILGEETEVYRGLLSDKSFESEVGSQLAKFEILGFESLLESVQVPFSSIANGDSVSNILYISLNQAEIIELLDLDPININPKYDAVIDDVSKFENTSVKDLLDDLLIVASSVLYIEDQTIFIKDREPTDDLIETFYGQASPNGPENIQDLVEIRSGVNRTFNLWKWEDTTLYARDESSVDTLGALINTIGFDFITDAITQQDILDTLLLEWAYPKQELILKTPLTYNILMLRFFDKISVDYPTIYFPFEDEPLAIYDVAVYDQDVYPNTEYSFTIDAIDRFKIMGINLNLKEELMELKLRRV